MWDTLLSPCIWKVPRKKIVQERYINDHFCVYACFSNYHTQPMDKFLKFWWTWDFSWYKHKLFGGHTIIRHENIRLGRKTLRFTKKYILYCTVTFERTSSMFESKQVFSDTTMNLSFSESIIQLIIFSYFKYKSTPTITTHLVRHSTASMNISKIRFLHHKTHKWKVPRKNHCRRQIHQWSFLCVRVFL